MEQFNEDREELSNSKISEDGKQLARLLQDISYVGYLDTTIREVKRDLIKRKCLAKIIYEHKDTFESEAKLFMNYYKTFKNEGFTDFESYDMLWSLLIENKGFNTIIGGSKLNK